MNKIIVAIVAVMMGSVVMTACGAEDTSGPHYDTAPVKEKPKEVQPNYHHKQLDWSNNVYEFDTTDGRHCVVASRDKAVALSCWTK